jgi:hypothetical protein
MITEMAEGWKDIQMVTSMMVNLKITSLMAKEFIPGSMARFTKVSGKQDLRKARAFGKVYLVTRI